MTPPLTVVGELARMTALFTQREIILRMGSEPTPANPRIDGGSVTARVSAPPRKDDV